MKRLLLSALLFTLAPATATAQYDDLSRAESSSSGGVTFGLGMRALLTAFRGGFGAGGNAALVVDVEQFRIEGVFGLSFVEDNTTTFGFAGRFLWLIHKSKRADLGVGAGIGFSHAEADSRIDNDVTLFHGEGLVQINIFLVENAAITGTLGLGIAAGDGPTSFAIGGQLIGGIGLTYFFR